MAKLPIRSGAAEPRQAVGTRRQADLVRPLLTGAEGLRWS